MCRRVVGGARRAHARFVALLKEIMSVSASGENRASRSRGASSIGGSSGGEGGGSDGGGGGGEGSETDGSLPRLQPSSHEPSGPLQLVSGHVEHIE